MLQPPPNLLLAGAGRQEWDQGVLRAIVLLAVRPAAGATAWPEYPWEVLALLSPTLLSLTGTPVRPAAIKMQRQWYDRQRA